MRHSHFEIRSVALLGVVAFGAVDVGACSQATAQSSRDERVVEVGASSIPGSPQRAETYRYRNDVQAAQTPLDVPVDAAWTRVARAYGDLKLPVTKIDSAAHVIGAERAAVRNRLAGDRVSRWLSCGDTPLGTPRADSYTVYLTMTTQVRPARTGSVAETIVTGFAESSGASTNSVQCASTGALEQRLQDAITKP